VHDVALSGIRCRSSLQASLRTVNNDNSVLRHARHGPQQHQLLLQKSNENVTSLTHSVQSLYNLNSSNNVIDNMLRCFIRLALGSALSYSFVRAVNSTIFFICVS